MLLFSIFVVVLGLLETSDVSYSFTGSRDVFNLHRTLRSTWTARDGTALNRNKFFTSCRQSWKGKKFDVVSTNESSPDEGDERPTNIYVCLEQKGGDSVIRGDGSLADAEQLNGFSNVVTNSGGAVIGGSCTGGFLVFCVLIYFLFKWLNEDTSVHPTNQNGASCPPPPYNHVVAIEECADPCTFMSKPSGY